MTHLAILESLVDVGSEGFTHKLYWCIDVVTAQLGVRFLFHVFMCCLQDVASVFGACAVEVRALPSFLLALFSL
jgi:hypothetical protein